MDEHQEWDGQLFGKTLRAVRNGFGYSLEEASQLSGVDRQMIHRIERGKMQHPSYPLVTKYATRAYPLTPNDIAQAANLWTNAVQPATTASAREGLAGEVEEYLAALPQQGRYTFEILVRTLMQQHKQVRFEDMVFVSSSQFNPDQAGEEIPDWLKSRLATA